MHSEIGAAVSDGELVSLAAARRRAARLFVAMVALLLSLLMSGTASSAPLAYSYCYRGTCYDSRADAEAAMRSQAGHVAYPRLKHRFTTVRKDGTVILHYYAPEIAFESESSAEFTAGLGWSGCDGSRNDPPDYYPCYSEQQLASELAEFLTRPRTQCQSAQVHFGGQYASPYADLSGAAGSNGQLAVVAFSGGNGLYRTVSWNIVCGGVPSSATVFIQKSQVLTCPSGYRFRHSMSEEEKLRRWPSRVFCYAAQETGQDVVEFIETRLLQTKSCAANQNPCFPATADKARFERDLEFAGRPFERVYHSVRQFAADALPVGWMHSLQERIVSTTDDVNTMYHIDARGYIETFVFSSLQSTAAVSTSGKGDTLTRVPGQLHLGYSLTSSAGEIRSFSRDGHLLGIQNPSSPSVNLTLEYVSVDANGFVTLPLTIAKDGAGRSLVFFYDEGLLSSIEGPGGMSVDISYEDGLLTEVSGPAGARIYHYTAGLLTGITDESAQRLATFSYDERGRVISSKLHANGAYVDLTTLAYNPDGAVDVTTDGSAHRKFFVSGSIYRNVDRIESQGSVEDFLFDVEGKLLRSIDRRGRVDTFAYANRRIDSHVEAMGTPSQRRTAFEYDLVGKRTARHVYSMEQGTESRVLSDLDVFDATGARTAHCQIDGVVTTVYPCGSAVDAPVGVQQVRYLRCTQNDVSEDSCPRVGLLKLIDGPRTDSIDHTSFVYRVSNHPDCVSDSVTCAHRKGDLWKVTDALGHVTEYLRYDGAGRALSVKDTDGVITDFEYHPRGWLTARKVRGTDASTEADDVITRISYWSTGLVKRVTQADGSYVEYTYDTAHRLTDITDNAGNTIHYTLDNAGNRTAEDTKDGAGTLKRTLSRVYNLLGQLETQADSASNPTDYTYDANGNVETVTDPLSRVTDNDYDPLNRLKRTLQDVGGIEAETSFNYDALDNLTKVTDPKGLDTEYKYNGLGDLLELKSPDTGTTTYTYDSAGNRKTQTDARGVTTTYAYDALNRLTAVSYPDSSLNVSYGYDAVGAACQAGETFAKGRLSSMADETGSTQYCYDRFGMMVRKVQTTGDTTFTLRYAYTKTGQLSSVTYPDGSVVAYQRNALGQIGQVDVTREHGGKRTLVSNVKYAPFGPATGWMYGNGRTLSRPLDLDYQPVALSDAAPGGLDVGFRFDAAGNLDALSTSGNATPLVTFKYDDLNRLEEFVSEPSGAVLEEYGYDKTGNRMSFQNSVGAQAYAYPADSHRLQAIGSVVREHDAAGNTTRIGASKDFVYSHTGRMRQVLSSGTVMATYGYNGRGERVRRTTGTSDTITLYDESGRWLGDYSATGLPLQQVVWLDDMPVGLMVGVSSDDGTIEPPCFPDPGPPPCGSEESMTALVDPEAASASSGSILITGIHYIEPDHLGTPRVVIHPERNVAVWHWDLKSEAFGNSPPHQDPDGDGAAFVLDMRFPGQRYDASSGLNYNYARDYEPGSGRYAQSDPIGLSGGLSTYGYVDQAPTILIDPYGLSASGNFSPGRGGNSAQRRQTTREFMRQGADLPPPNLRPPPGEPDDPMKSPSSSDGLTPLQRACRQSGQIADICGPGPDMKWGCTRWSCGWPDDRYQCPSDRERRPIMTGPGWRPENDPTCRCERYGWLN